jgi:hypothetical protein
MTKKIELGQFYTKKNIFSLTPFLNWWNLIPISDKETILEPFAGANNIIKSLFELGLIKNYKSFDIEPNEETVQQQDTLKNFPSGFQTIVTNPPYISKNSARRKNMQINMGNENDLYEFALKQCLDNAKYVAAIIPESFITTNKFKLRLDIVISLTYNDMFSDTEHPVCLALFSDNESSNFEIYRNDVFIGEYKVLSKIKNEILNSNIDCKILFNIPKGHVHLLAVDNQKNEDGIFFTLENIVKEEEIKISSRAKTRIDIFYNNALISDQQILKNVVNDANFILNFYRKQTEDVFMTSFKGIRKDNKYRRRLDYHIAKSILMKALENEYSLQNKTSTKETTKE